jgi:signal transduction histidine kinase
MAQMQEAAQPPQPDTVQIRIEPFVPVVVGGTDVKQSMFGGQVFMLRHVQIEDRHIRQGFRLNEPRLIEEVRKSADLLKLEGMTFSLPQVENGGPDSTPVAESVAYEAVLDFGFGRLILHLLEQDPGWIARQVAQLRQWYFSIVTVVLLAVSLGLLSLWRYAHAQMKLAEQKDDFISAVSHELRTPLTYIRMYSEMLEKKWVKSENKLREYYSSMRQESERLSRLIENVLDFSRIQKGRKKYHFSGGDLNESVAAVVEMMRPYAVQNGFSIKTELPPLPQIAFDHDAIKQIVVNLLDNAVKYARDATDRTITIRTRGDSRYVFIEVEDHGPGVPHTQRKRIFEQFYRTQAEATRETTGTGLGLALVKKFAQAHNGFVEILNAKPAGAIFRVALAAHI